MTVVWGTVSPPDDMSNGYCVPTSTDVRGDGFYNISTRASDAAAARSGTCRKGTHTFTEVMPGIFAFFCPHGICLAFFFMNNFESPETLFSFIMQRRRKAPPVLIYDNNCNELDFCLNRSAG